MDLVSDEEIKKLYQKFNQLDVDGSGTLEPNEFFDVPGILFYIIYIELGQNPLVNRVIDVFDKNKDGKISFAEFVQGLSSLHAEGMYFLYKKLIIICKPIFTTT